MVMRDPYLGSVRAMPNLTSLPLELTREIINYLPIPSLLSFGLTSKDNHAIQAVSLSTLQLGVFHSHLSGMISFLESSSGRSSIHSVPVTLARNESRTKDQVIRHQNNTVRSVLDRYRHTLRDLELVMWNLTEATSVSLAGLRNLRRLSLRFDHPYTRHRDLDKSFWDTSPGSTVWNNLAALRGKGTSFGRLESLNLERSGITDYQLQQILQNNPRLTELRLQKCLSVTEETFEYLGGSDVGERLEVLHVTKTDSKGIDERVLKHIAKFRKLKASLQKKQLSSTGR